VEQYTGGDRDWYRLLHEHGAKLPEDLLNPEKGGGLRKVRTFVANTWLFIAKCQADAVPSDEVSSEEVVDLKEDWVPENIGGGK
jgi:hypothetical protein